MIESPARRRLFLRLSLALACLAADAAGAAAPAAVESDAGMVVTSQHLASEVGAAVLRRGGNAIDAAVAVGFALAVTHPCCGNLGGGGFMTIHLAGGRNTFINFREKAPLAARADMFLDAHGNPDPSRSFSGYLAAGVPGTVLGLETARREYGTMPLAALIAPAIGLAETGFVLNRGDADEFADEAADSFPTQPNIAAVFLKEGRRLLPGDRLRQPELAATLRKIGAGGPRAFYNGAIADAVAAASRAHGGMLTAADFAAYDVTESAPVRCNYRGYTILSAPPPSSGGVILCEMLQVLEGYPLKSRGFHSSTAIHWMTEGMRHAYRDRNALLGDPAFVENPVARLISSRHAAEIRAYIQPQRATPSRTLGAEPVPHEGATTTHYSVADRLGNAVAVTYTINDAFGAKVIAADTGFFLNDEMDDFTAKPGAPNAYGLVQGSANAIAPGKRPLSSMCPTIVLADGRPVLILGSPGGSRIITTVLEVLVNVIDFGMTLPEAIDAPRFHHQYWPDTLAAEPFALSADTAQALTRMGYRLVPLPPWGSGNAVEAIGIARDGVFHGASDARAPSGSAAAP